MTISVEGRPFDPAVQRAIQEFVRELEAHPHGGPVTGRLVQAEPDPQGGITQAMRNTLRLYMKPEDFARWNAAHVGSTVAVVGKTFVADDERVTAVIFPMPPNQHQEFIDIAAHEVVEMARLIRAREQRRAWPDDPDEADGLVLFDEYRNERIREEIRQRLGWPEGRIDAEPDLISMIDDIEDRLPPDRHEDAPLEFFKAWLEMARVWAMLAGRAAVGSTSAKRALEVWAGHDFIADGGWLPIAATLDDFYRQPEIDQDHLARAAGAGIRAPIIEYARAVWRGER